MEKTKILLAGTGGYGAKYLNEFLDKNDGSYELAGIIDPLAERSPRYGEIKALSIPVYAKPEDFFAERRADLSVIASPIHTHYPYVLACFENGSNVLCEKPVCASLSELDEIIKKEKETGLFAAVGFQLSFQNDVLALKKDILDGLFGSPLEFKAMRLARRGNAYYSRNGWVGKLSYEGRLILDGPLLNGCAHELHNIFFLLGNEMATSRGMEKVEAELWRARPGIENYDAAAIRFICPGGVKGLFYTAHCVEELTPCPLGEFRFEKALVRWGENSVPGITAYFDDGRIKNYNEIGKGYDLKKFHDSLAAARGGNRPVCTAETAKPHLQCVAAVQEFPAKKVPPEKLKEGKTEDGDTFYYVQGLAAAFIRAYNESILPAETGFEV